MHNPERISRIGGWLFLFSLCFSFLLASPDILLKNKPEKEILSNGMTVIFQKDDASLTTVIQILIRGGRRGEAQGKDGVAFLTTRLCLDLPDQQQLQRLMNQATTRTFFPRQDFSIIKISCLSENLEDAIKLSAKILRDPLISGLRIDRTKDIMNHYRKLQEDDPINLAHEAAMSSFFSGTPYASSSYGTEESLKRIKKRDVEGYFKKYVKAGNMIVTVSSDLDKEKAMRIMRPYFEDFLEGMPAEPALPAFSPVEEKSIALEKDTRQTLVYMAFPLPKISERSYVLSMMLQHLLGIGTNSKLWPLRTEKKLAYLVNSRAFLMEEGGMLEAYLETDQSKEASAQTELKKTIEDLYRDGISQEELSVSKTHSKGMVIRENETKDGKTYNLTVLEASGLGFDFLNRLLSEIEATTLEEFNAFIREVLDPERRISITVGPSQLP